MTDIKVISGAFWMLWVIAFLLIWAINLRFVSPTVRARRITEMLRVLRIIIIAVVAVGPIMVIWQHGFGRMANIILGHNYF